MSSDPGQSIAYEPQFSLSALNVIRVREHCHQLLLNHSGIKHTWDPNGWPFRNLQYTSTMADLERSGELIELNAAVVDTAEKVVFLRRRNQFARVISDLLMQQTQLWGHFPDRSHTEAEPIQYRLQVMSYRPSPIDPAILEWYMTNGPSQEEALIERVPKSKKLVVYYEDLFDQDRWNKRNFSHWQALASWIGVRPRVFDPDVQNIMKPTNKYNSEAVYERIPNYKSLVQKFAS